MPSCCICPYTVVAPLWLVIDLIVTLCIYFQHDLSDIIMRRDSLEQKIKKMKKTSHGAWPCSLLQACCCLLISLLLLKQRFPQGRHIKISTHPTMEKQKFLLPLGLADFKHLSQLPKPLSCSHF